LYSTATEVPRLTAGRGMIVEQSVRVVAAGLEFSRKHKALLSAKLNHVRLDSELNETFGRGFAPDAVSSRYEITEG
jgi:hypothetical protein